jgi:glycosidase
MKNNCFVLSILTYCILMLVACKEDIHRPADLAIPDNTKITPISKNNRVIYEVNVRNYSATGDFAGVERSIPRLKELGVDILWLMPIHPIGEVNRAGSLGSPYAATDYRGVNPEFGTPADLKSLIAAAHAANMEVWLDWVANHTAWDHHWLSEHLDFYAERNGQRPYSPDGWDDVIQLDFNNPAMRNEMIEAMKYWVQEFDIDGYRCDAVMFVPLDFWREARIKVDAVKPITWLAEGDDPSYMEVFDLDYAWAFNTSLNEFGEDRNLSHLIAECHKLVGNPNYKDRGRMVYLTNHDLSAFDGTEFVRYRNNVMPLSVLYFTLYDMPLIYNGQEIGLNKAISLFDRDPLPWEQVNSRYVDLFKRLTWLKRTQPALTGGEGRAPISRFQTNHEDKMLVYSRKKGDNEVLVMLNLSDNPVRFKFTTANPIGQFEDYLKGGTAQFSTSDYLTLPANGYAVYIKNPA